MHAFNILPDGVKRILARMLRRVVFFQATLLAMWLIIFAERGSSCAEIANAFLPSTVIILLVTYAFCRNHKQFLTRMTLEVSDQMIQRIVPGSPDIRIAKDDVRCVVKRKETYAIRGTRSTIIVPRHVDNPQLLDQIFDRYRYTVLEERNEWWCPYAALFMMLVPPSVLYYVMKNTNAYPLFYLLAMGGLSIGGFFYLHFKRDIETHVRVMSWAILIAFTAIIANEILNLL